MYVSFEDLQMFECVANDGELGQTWYLVFAMGLTGAIFWVWVMIMAYQVFVRS
jgi:hypothetical protein